MSTLLKWLSLINSKKPVEYISIPYNNSFTTNKQEIIFGNEKDNTDDLKIPNKNCKIYINCKNATKIKNILINYKLCSDKKYVSEIINNIILYKKSDIDPIQYIDSISKDDLSKIINMIDKYIEDYLIILNHLITELLDDYRTESLTPQIEINKIKQYIIKYSNLIPSQIKKNVYMYIKYIENYIYIKMFINKERQIPQINELQDISETLKKDLTECNINFNENNINIDINVKNDDIQIMKIEKVTESMYKHIKRNYPAEYESIQKIKELNIDDTNNAYLIYTGIITDINLIFKTFNIEYTNSANYFTDDVYSINFKNLCIIADIKEKYRLTTDDIKRGFTIITNFKYRDCF